MGWTCPSCGGTCQAGLVHHCTTVPVVSGIVRAPEIGIPAPRPPEPLMDDPQVLGYWRDWLKVREAAIVTGWTFASYVAARLQGEQPVTSYATSTAQPGLTG
jgi:hypothetical protein